MTKEELEKVVQGAEYDFLRENPHLGSNIMFLTLGGSHAYGTNVPGSDVDVRGVTGDSKYDLLGFGTFEQVVEQSTDTTIYGFRKLVSLLINREDKRLSNSVVDILNMLEMGESVDMIASDMNSKTTNIRRIIRENDIGQDTISTTLQWRKAIKKLLPDREANVIRWNESKESAIPYKLCVPKHFLNAAGSAPVTVIPVIAMLRNTPPDYFGQNLEVIPWRTIVQHLLSDDDKQCVRFVLRKWEAANPEEAALGNPLGYKDVSRRRYAEKLDSIGMTHCLYGDLENILPKEFSVARI